MPLLECFVRCHIQVQGELGDGQQRVLDMWMRLCSLLICSNAVELDDAMTKIALHYKRALRAGGARSLPRSL